MSKSKTILEKKLPKNWVNTNLEIIITKLESGGRPKGGVKGIEEGIPSIGAEHLGNHGDFNLKNIRFIPEEFYKKMVKGHIKDNDILIVKDGATTGKIAIINEKFPFDESAVNEHVFIVRGIEEVVFQKYLFYYLFSNAGQKIIKNRITGSAQGGINTSFIRNFPIPLPPLKEQERIVLKIEKLLIEIDNVNKSLERSKPKLKTYRQSLLNSAFVGNLTKKWRNKRGKSESVVKLFEKISQEKNIEEISFSNTGGKIIPDVWAWAKLETISINHDGKRIPVSATKRELMQGKIPYYGASGIIDYVDKEIFNGNYLLIGEDGANLLSRSTPISFIAKGKFWVNNHAHILSTCGDIPLEYLVHYLNSVSLTKWITGSAQPKLNQKNLNQIPIPIAPLEEQKEIISIIKNEFSLIENTKKIIDSTLQQSKRLELSILEQAFAGKLVKQDPKDDPASELLKKLNQKKT